MPNKRTSRRDAVKALGAITAGTALTLGSWEKPVVRVGALPAYAQTSGITFSFDPEIACGTNQFAGSVNQSILNNMAISPAVAGVVVNLQLSGSYTVSVGSDPQGNYTTDVNGLIIPGPNWTLTTGFFFQMTWTFVSPAQAGSCVWGFGIT